MHNTLIIRWAAELSETWVGAQPPVGAPAYSTVSATARVTLEPRARGLRRERRAMGPLPPPLSSMARDRIL